MITSNITVGIFFADLSTALQLQYVDSGISAGFPSPAMDFVENGIDLNRELIKHPSSTFYGRVRGNSMDKYLKDGDLLIIDRSITPVSGKIAVCYLENKFTIKRLKIEKQHIWLLPENDAYQPILVTPENDFIVWGIVTYVIKKL